FSQAEESLFEDGKLLNELVDNKVLDMVNDVLVIIHRELPEYVLNNRLKYAIAMHLDAVIERIKSGKIIKHPDLEEIKKSNNKLYNISKKIIKYLNEEYRLQIPRDEVGYITMYLNNLDMNQSPNRTSAQPAIIVISHGGVASEMLKVANWLIGDSKAKAIDMHLDQPPMQILDELIYTAKKIDQGKGILLLVDMGSLKSFGDVITERTGIKTRVIPRVDTVMLMEAIRWAKFDNLELDDLVSRIYHSSNKYSRTKRKEVILIYCITGEGAALRVKDYLINRIPELENQHEIITTGIHDKNINHYINKLEKNYNLNAVIGNLKPDRQVNNFYDFEKIYSEAGFDRFIEKLNLKNKLKSKNNPQLLLNKNLIYLKPKVKNKEEALKFLSQKLIRAGVVKESYYKAVKEKENWSVTYVGDGIAIPHADSKHVNYSQFALAILEEKIEWSGFKVDVICMFAFKDLETENFRKFYSKLKKKLSYIKKAEEIEVVKEALING
ncbi:MAG: PRD domain-containing protein, partial [Halanaerobium sp. MSAO_Bac5]